MGGRHGRPACRPLRGDVRAWRAWRRLCGSSLSLERDRINDGQANFKAASAMQPLAAHHSALSAGARLTTTRRTSAAHHSAGCHDNIFMIDASRTHLSHRPNVFIGPMTNHGKDSGIWRSRRFSGGASTSSPRRRTASPRHPFESDQSAWRRVAAEKSPGTEMSTGRRYGRTLGGR